MGTPSPFPEPADPSAFPEKFAKEGLTFDDVLLIPAESNVLPAIVDTATRLTPRIELAVPIVSAAMDTVTEAQLAIALARAGGIGIVHRNLSIPDQVSEVDRVKRSQSGMIADPVTLPPDARIADALELMARYHISGVPIADAEGHLLGLLTNRDLRFAEGPEDRPVAEVMRRPPLVTAPVGTTLDAAKAILWEHRIEKLPIVDDDGRLRGLITIKDITKAAEFPHATVDERGRLRVGAAVGVGAEGIDRAEALVGAGVDVLVVDSAHGHNQGVLDTVKEVKSRFDVEVIAGNVATADAVDALVGAGADAVKVGIGPGCFAAGTRVLMADATYKDIQDVVAGDRVINMHGEPVTVVRSWCTGIRDVVAVRHSNWPTETVVTADHRYLARARVAALTARSIDADHAPEWHAIGQAPDGCTLVVPRSIRFVIDGEDVRLTPSDGEPDEFESVELLGVRSLGISVPVYDIEVDCDTHSFIADNAIVHNSICTTRVIAGVGMPQVTTIYDCAVAAARHGVTVIADGGVQQSGDIAKAVAAGADCVMLGSMLAGVEEAPGEVVFDHGERYKEYRGMGSLGAMKTRSFSKDRYFQGDVTEEPKLVPEGIEGRVPYKGPVSGVLYQMVGGLRAAMGYTGSATIAELKERARFVRISTAGLRESHPHDITITKQAPNYFG